LNILREGCDSIIPIDLVLEYDSKLWDGECYFTYMLDSTNLLSVDQISSYPDQFKFYSIIDKGILISSVEPEHIANELDIKEGDVFLSFNRGYDSWLKLWGPNYSDRDTLIKVLRDSLEFENHIDLRDYPELRIKSKFQDDLQQGSVWLRIITDNRLSEDKTVLFRCVDTYDRIVFYKRSPDGTYSENITGTTIPNKERDFHFYKGKPITKVTLRESIIDTLYIKVEQEGGFNHPPFFDSLAYDYVVWFENIERLVLGALLGMMCIVAIYFCILFFFMKDKSYLIYFLFIVSLVFTLFELSGYGDDWLWPDSIYFFQRITHLFTIVPFTLFILFGSSYLGVRKGNIRVYRIGRLLLIIAWILSLIVLTDEFLRFGASSFFWISANVLMAACLLALLVLTFLVSIKRTRQNYRPAKFFLAGMIVLLISVVLFLLTYEISGLLITLFNLSPDITTILLMASIYMGAIVQFLILAIGLSEKMRDSDREIRKSQQNLIIQMKENEALKDKVNRELEEKVQERTKEITDSINYAKRIQTAVLPPEEELEKILPEYFVLFKPRDIVSGDFYWVKQIKNFTIVVAADCTGHGVPGAFMSMLGMSFLNELVTKSRFDSAGELLNRLRKKVKDTLKQEGKALEQKDGMDLALAIIDNESLEMQYSGAFNPVFIIRKADKSDKDLEEDYNLIQAGAYTLIEIKGDRQPIAIHYAEKDFKTKNFQLRKKDSIYLFSDGYPDQMGGPHGKKFMARKFKKLILEIQEYSMAKQKEVLDETIENWRGSHEQIDDIIVFGIRW
ncbi:MAG: 7TM diverse intracellular signaling domain-containing protein, partial [Marinilabiliaceae bacterium]|jgi:serine phosphatase RsbU (regulator of sigma subunit)|nr:7TM diverse intracellular signaling domain-containing protein [Marinilabiliaceae bacterium]